MVETVAREEIVAAFVAIALGLVGALILSLAARLMAARRVLKDQRLLLAELAELAFETTIRPNPRFRALNRHGRASRRSSPPPRRSERSTTFPKASSTPGSTWSTRRAA